MKPESEEIESEWFHLIFDCSHDSDVYDQMKIKLSKSHAEAEEPANHNTSSQDIRGLFSFHKSLATVTSGVGSLLSFPYVWFSLEHVPLRIWKRPLNMSLTESRLRKVYCRLLDLSLPSV